MLLALLTERISDTASHIEQFLCFYWQLTGIELDRIQQQLTDLDKDEVGDEMDEDGKQGSGDLRRDLHGAKEIQMLSRVRAIKVRSLVRIWTWQHAIV